MKITERQYNERWSEIIESDLDWREREEAKDKLWREYIEGVEVGDRMNVKLWTDVEPCTVIKRTAKSITVRYDKAELDPNWEAKWVIGGFSAICTNDHEQKWIITEDKDSQRTETFRLTKLGWAHNGCLCNPGWRKYYDYNF